MKMITLFVPEASLKKLDRLVEQNIYPNRAEAIREAIKDFLRLHNSWVKE